MKRSKDKTKTRAALLPGYLLFLLAALACAPLHSPAQIILNAFPCPDQGTLPEGCPQRPYNITMELSSGAATAWSVTSGPAWFTRQSNTATSAVFGTGAANIPLGDAGITFPIDISATVGALTVSANFSLAVRLPGATCPAGFTVQPCQREIVYVLDKSGSMNWDADPGDGLPTTRWQKLVEVVESQLLTLDDLSLSLVESDSFDVVLFGGDIRRVSSGSFFNVPPDIDDVIPPATVVSGGTPLGGGIQMALKRSFNGLGRPGGGKKRLVFMVSDGEQNMNPMINTATYSSVACEAGGFPANGVTLTDDVEPLLPVVPPLGAEVIDLTSSVNDPIERYNVGVGIGMTGAAHDLMDGSGDKYESTLGVADLDVLMDAMMTGTYLAATSPRVLDSRRGVAGDQDNPTIERFYVNDSVQHLTVKFFTLNQPFSDAHVDVLKDGFPIYPKLTVRDFLRLLHINFENPYWAGTNSGSLSPTGWWEFRVYDKRQTAYRVTAFVEDKRIHQSLELGSGGKLYAGDPLPLRFQLRYRDDGMPDAKARAFLYRPGDDLGDLAADAKAPQDLPLSEPGGTAAQAKIDYLVQQPGFYQKLQEEERVIDLVDQGDGAYTGTFTGNVATGGYRVMVRVEGEHAVGGKYQGWSMEGIFYDFARADDIRLNESVVSGGRDGTAQFYTLVIKPTNQFGKKLGPGQSGRIRVDLAPPATATGDLTDNLDGSYTLRFRAPANSNPQISVYVIDRQQPVKVFPARTGKWDLSLHAGLTVPRTNLDSLYDSSVFVEADITYRLKPNLDLELLGGYYGFKSDFNVLGGALCLGYTPYSSPSGWYLRAVAGAGLYKPKNLDGTLGYTGRLDLGKSINSHLKIALQGGYVYLDKPDMSFFSAGLGLKYFF